MSINYSRSESLYIGFVRASGFLSGLIEWFGAGSFSHVTTLVPSNHQYVIDARSDRQAGVSPGVQMRPLSYLQQWTVV